MTKIKAFLVALAMTLGLAGAIVATQSPASATIGSAYCPSGTFWYFHAPYIIGNDIASWGTCAPTGTTVNYAGGDTYAPNTFGLMIIHAFESSDTTPDGSGFFTPYGINYETNRTLSTWGDSVYAAVGCTWGDYENWYGGFYGHVNNSYGDQWTGFHWAPCNVVG